MSDPVTLDAPILGEPALPSVPVRDEKWQRERLAFYRMLPELLAAHRNRYIAVHEGQVVGIGDDLISVAKAAYARHGYVPIYVGFVAEPPPRHIRMPSFRSVSWGPR